MIYPTVPFPVTSSDTLPRFQGHGVIFMPIDALSVSCAQLMRDLLATAKFLFYFLQLCAPLKTAGQGVAAEPDTCPWTMPHAPSGLASIIKPFSSVRTPAPL